MAKRNNSQAFGEKPPTRVKNLKGSNDPTDDEPLVSGKSVSSGRPPTGQQMVSGLNIPPPPPVAPSWSGMGGTPFMPQYGYPAGGLSQAIPFLYSLSNNDLAAVRDMITGILSSRGIILASASSPATGQGSDSSGPAVGAKASLGYTTIKGGKVIKNKRAATRPLQVRQAETWRKKAGQAFASVLKQHGIEYSNDVRDSAHTDREIEELRLKLGDAVAYQAAVKAALAGREALPEEDAFRQSQDAGRDLKVWSQSKV
jgi:hypothetical protein